MPDTQEIAVFVPANATVPTPFASKVVAGSAIVGPAGNDQAELVTVYYEGNIHGFANVETYADCARLAAGRLAKNYPTVARASVPRHWLRQVGWFDFKNGITLLDDPQAKEALASWLGVEVIEEEELHFSE